MITYTVKYKKPSWLFWRKLRKVKGDGLVETNLSRFFILDDNTRVEMPTEFMFKFSKGRFLAIEEEMKKETGQRVGG